MDSLLTHRRTQSLLFNWLPLISWMALIFWASSQPEVPHPGREMGLPDDLVAWVAHASLFGVLALLVWRVLQNRPQAAVRARIPALSLGTVALSALYAASDEVHQLSVPGRMASLSDWLADVVGILIAVGLLAWWVRKRDQDQTPARYGPGT